MNTLRQYAMIIGFLVCIFIGYAFAETDADEPYAFMNAVIQATKMIKSSADQFAPKEIPSGGINALFLVTQMRTNFDSAISDVKKARALMEDYKDSKNKFIKEADEAMLVPLDLLIDNYQKEIEHFEAMTSAQGTSEEDKKKMSDQARELMSARKDILRLCTASASLSTGVLLVNPFDAENKLLVISAKQRDDLKKDLEDFFGDNIKQGLKGVPDLSWAPAAIIYEFLSKDLYPLDKNE